MEAKAINITDTLSNIINMMPRMDARADQSAKQDHLQDMVKRFVLDRKANRTALTRSHKTMRSLDEMVDVLNFTLYDLSCIGSCHNNTLLQDMLAILERSKKTLVQASFEISVQLKRYQSIFMMTIYAVIQGMGHLIKSNLIQDNKLRNELQDIEDSLVHVANSFFDR